MTRQEIIESLVSVALMMHNHPDNTEGSEFNDRLNDINIAVRNLSQHGTGIKYKSGAEICEGDKIKVTICKNVETKGVVAFEKGAFGVAHNSFGAEYFTPLCSFASTCVFEKIKLHS